MNTAKILNEADMPETVNMYGFLGFECRLCGRRKERGQVEVVNESVKGDVTTFVYQCKKERV